MHDKYLDARKEAHTTSEGRARHLDQSLHLKMLDLYYESLEKEDNSPC